MLGTYRSGSWSDAGTRAKENLAPSSVVLRIARLSLVMLVLIASTLATVVGVSGPASASHYRANQLSWHQDTGNTVEFHYNGSWRCSFFFSTCDSSIVGQTFEPDPIDFGDGSAASITVTVSSVDGPNDVVNGEAHIEHTYPGPGPFTASIDTCCRLSAPEHVNNPDGSFRVETIVDLSKTTASPVSLVAPIVDCPIEATCAFSVPATDPDRQGIRWRLSTAAESYLSQPTRASINPSTGLYTWDTRGAALSPSGSSFYSTQVMVENVVAGVVVTKTPVDFFIRLGSNSTNQQPTFASPTPADGAVISGTVGSPLMFSVSASDPDANDTVTPGIIGAPTSATFTTTRGNPGTGVFSWTPTTTGDTLLTLTASDQNGLGATPRGITLRVAPAPVSSKIVQGAGSYQTPTGAYHGVSIVMRKTTGGATGDLQVRSGGAGSQTFQSKGVAWTLSSTGNAATFSGTGTLNGQSGFSFTATAADVSRTGAGDTFDIVVTRTSSGATAFTSGGRRSLNGGNLTAS